MRCPRACTWTRAPPSLCWRRRALLWWCGRYRVIIMQPGAWSIVLLFLMMVAIILELLTPSMGGFTVLAIAATGGSIFMGFKESDTQGYIMIAANLITFPITLWLGVKYMKLSPLMLHREVSGGFQAAPDAPPLNHLLGQEGKTLTPLRPAGAAMVGA